MPFGGEAAQTGTGLPISPSMAFNRKFSEEPESYPMQIYFVEKIPRSMAAAKKFGLPVVEPESNNNVMKPSPISRTIYIFNDFESHRMFPLVERTPNTWILGPTALDEMARDPNLEIRTKPTYCTFMYGFVFYINCPDDYPLMRRMVKWIKWMGGRFVLEPKFQTTHMITTSTRAKGYTYCATFNVPILSPAWVEHCWLKRHIPNYDVTSAMGIFQVTAFLDLYIAIKGFSSEDLKCMERKARLNGAVVVTPEDPRCTHLGSTEHLECGEYTGMNEFAKDFIDDVFSKDIAKYVNINDVPTHISYIVDERWFRSSLDQEQRVHEDSYLCFSSKEIRKSLWAVMDSEETSEKCKRKSSAFKASLNNEDKIFLENAKKECQDVKRKYAFEDLHLKEKNYLRCLRQLLIIKNLATVEAQLGGPILNQAEAKVLFGNLEKLVELHQELTDSFEEILMNWKNDAITVQRIVNLQSELLKQYVIYTNNYKESKKLIEKYEIENKRFRKLLESSMKNRNKEHPKDIFIRPIQRLCSVVLQLREISKSTREDNPDKQVLNKAIQVVNEVLQKINNSQEQVEKLKCIFDIHRLIKDCPPDLVTSHREFIVQFSAQEVVSRNNLGMQVMFFLFNDTLEITKIRMKAQSVMKNHNASDCLKEKPYKHIATLPLSMIMNVIDFQGNDEDDQNMFGFHVRDAKREKTMCIHCFQYKDDDCHQLNEILLLIAKQLAQGDSSKHPKDFILASVPTSVVSASISPNPETKRLFKMYDFLKIPNKKPQTNNPLRKSLSCGDLIASSNEL